MNHVKTVYLNGAFVAAGEASISPFDRGFLFGDGVYEVIPAYGGRAFRLDLHLERLATSLAAIGLDNPFNRRQWTGLVQRLLVDAGDRDHTLYLQVTRGVAPRDHGFPQATPATVFCYAEPMVPVGGVTLSGGAAAITVEDNRWGRCDIKAVSLLPNVLLRQQALEAGAAEAILVRDGQLTEGAASNVLLVVDDTLTTAPESALILPGITRRVVLELAAREGIAVSEIAPPRQTLVQASEIMLCSSMRGLWPVTRLDGHPVGDGRPGPVCRRLQRAFDAHIADFRAGVVDG